MGMHKDSVLVVDDEKVNIMVLSRYLDAEGYEVTTASSGPLALDAIKVRNFDAVLLDVMMPVMDGYEVLEQIRKHYSQNELPVIMVTALEGSEHIVSALELGANDYVQKPVNLSVMLARLKNHLALKHSIVAKEESEARYRDLFNNANTLIQSVRADGSFEYVNETWHKVLGYDEDDLKALSVFDIVHPSNQEHCQALFQRLMAGESVDRIEALFLSKEGREVAVEGTASCLYEDGHLINTRSIFHDVTDKRKAEHALEEKNHLLFSFQKIGWAALSSLRLDVVLDTLVEQIVSVGVFRSLMVALVDEDAHKVTVVREAFKDSNGEILHKSESLQSDPYDLDDHNLTAEVARTGEMVVVDGWDERYDLRRKLSDDYYQKTTSYFLPVKQGNRVLAVLATASDRDKKDETLRHIEQVTPLLDQIAMALSQVTLYQSLLAQSQKMDNLNRRLQKEVVERRRIEKALREANDELDRRVADRTAALAESEERFSQLAEKIHQAFYVATLPDRQSLYLSPGFEAIWGIPVERAYQRPEFFVESVFEEDRGIVASALEQENLGIATETEYRIVRADGDVRWIHDQAFPLKNEAGEVYRVVGTSEDITEQKMLAEQLLQSQKMNAVGKLAGGVAHDFNNLLTVINGYSKLGLRKLGEEDPMRINLEEIRKAGERAQGLTSQLLAFSRKQMLKPEVLNLNKLYVNFEKMLRRLIGEDIDLSATLRAQGQIKADPVQLEQVLINLVVNARDAMQLGGVLTIETGDVVLDQADAQRYDVPAGRYVCLSVKDTGIGMDQETRTRMFEPFFTTKEQDKGTGLGLSTVYGIVSQSGGVIQVDSQVNKGTAFHIYFPWHRDDSTVDQRESHQEDIVKGFGRVLVAEDEDMVRLLTVTVLQESGYQVLEARNAKDAIQLFEAYQGEIDLLVTDVVMPQMSGKELADHLCSLQPKLRILYISGYLDDVKDKHEILESQVAFLQKPFMPGELSTKVRDVLDDPIS